MDDALSESTSKKESIRLSAKHQARISKVAFNLPFGIGGVEWVPDTAEIEAAWSLYIELVTRIAVQPLAETEGLLREALASLYTLFGSTREILRAAGPRVGIRADSVGGIAISVLNNGLRPVLSKWHPLLLEWEYGRPTNRNPRDHEGEWSEAPKLRDELEALRMDLSKYADSLAEIAGAK